MDGDVAVYILGRNQIPRLTQQEQIFPVPQGQPGNSIRLMQHMFFGNDIDPGRNPNDTFDLDPNDLRRIASEIIVAMGYTPA
ncbi:hypothetical protein BJX76DRAFT_361921 [Aspergillus varians]